MPLSLWQGVGSAFAPVTLYCSIAPLSKVKESYPTGFKQSKNLIVALWRPDAAATHSTCSDRDADLVDLETALILVFCSAL